MIQSLEEGRKEDGNRSIANKIISRLHDLEKTIENNQGRWAWELLQNAIDSISNHNNRKISVQIVLRENEIEFSHNGSHFTEKDIRGLINQISSKEVEEGKQTKQTGRFGTGFLTTHLLSKTVNIKGILESENHDFFKFSFALERDGTTTSQLIPKIEKAWQEFHNSAEKIDKLYNIENYNTSFNYKLVNEEQKRVANVGVLEFVNLIPFVISFIPKISKIEIIDEVKRSSTCFDNINEFLEKNIKTISCVKNNINSIIHILIISEEKLSLAVEVEKLKIGYGIKSLKDIPKIFCNFPLIGTENFHFPMIINSFYFNPQTERDGVWLKGDADLEVQENKKIFELSVVLYEKLLNEISKNTYFDLYNLIDTKLPITNRKYFDDEWFRESIQKPVRELIIDSELVEIDDDSNTRGPISKLWFPINSYSNPIKENLWQFTKDMFPEVVSKKTHLMDWCEFAWDSWNKITFEEIAKDVSGQENVGKLSSTLGKDEDETFSWLNSFGKFLLKEDNNVSLFENFRITPNQNGDFKKRSELNIDKIEDDGLIRILKLLGEDWKNSLLHKKILYNSYIPKDKRDIATKIAFRIQKNQYDSDDTKKAIILLSEWFENNESIAKDLFSELYGKRAELFMNTISDKDSLYKVMRSKVGLSSLLDIAQSFENDLEFSENIQNGLKIAELLKEFHVEDISALKTILSQAKNNENSNDKSVITQDILLSLGITSIQELEDALKDKEIASQFYHNSTPNLEMFLYVKNILNRARENISNHLKTLPDYDCSDLEELATTVLGGIKKDGLLIHVVARPSDNGEVIIYYSSEKDTLDQSNAELWIDDGIRTPRQLTLGSILRATGINRIPVK